jgi:hypothetical protein
MMKGLTVDEVRNGLEALLGRHKKARQLWRAEAASVIREEVVVTDQPDPGHFVYRYERGAAAAAPAGWTAVYDAKKTLTVTETPAEEASATPVVSVQTGAAGKPAAKPKTAAKRKPAVKRWSWRSPAGVQVLGYGFSPDGRRLGWVGKARTGGRRTLNIVDLGKPGKGRTVVTDREGTVLGDVMAFLPYSDKVIVPYGNYVMVSDLRGGNRTSFPLEADRGRREVFKGRQVEWLATTSDGLELLLAMGPPPAKKRKAGAEPDARPLVYWKVGLGVASF